MLKGLSLYLLRSRQLISQSLSLRYRILHLSLESQFHFGVALLQSVELLSQTLSDRLVLGLKLLIFLRMHLLDILKSLGSLLLADDRLALTALDIAHYLIVSRLLLLVLLSLLAELKL